MPPTLAPPERSGTIIREKGSAGGASPKSRGQPFRLPSRRLAGVRQPILRIGTCRARGASLAPSLACARSASGIKPLEDSLFIPLPPLALRSGSGAKVMNFCVREELRSFRSAKPSGSGRPRSPTPPLGFQEFQDGQSLLPGRLFLVLEPSRYRLREHAQNPGHFRLTSPLLAAPLLKFVEQFSDPGILGRFHHFGAETTWIEKEKQKKYNLLCVFWC